MLAVTGANIQTGTGMASINYRDLQTANDGLSVIDTSSSYLHCITFMVDMHVHACMCACMCACACIKTKFVIPFTVGMVVN